MKSKDEAVAWARRCPAGPDEVIEIRQVFEMEDFREDVQEVAARFPDIQQQAGRRGSG